MLLIFLVNMLGLAQANLITKTDFDAKLSSLNKKITANKTIFGC